MANRQIGWSQESNLLWQISALLTRLTQVTAANSGTTGLTSVGLTMPLAFDVANSPLTVDGTLAVTANGFASQYIRGDGQLASFPDIAGYVPYTGATQAVNLGAYDLTVNGLTVGKGNNNITTNTALGISNLSTVTTAIYNTAIGVNSLQILTTGNYNVGVGGRALYLNQVGIGNTAIGIFALNNATNDYNTALGASAGQSLTTGTYNTFIGKQAGFGMLSGTKNIVISSRTSAGSGITTGSYNTIIGNEIGGLDAALSNNIILADGQGNIKYRWDGTTNTITGDLAVTGVLRPTVTTSRKTSNSTLAIADRGKLVEMNVATANNLTIPLDSTVAFPIGTQLEVAQYGAGQTTIVGAVGVTIRSASGNLKIASQYVAISLIKIGTNEWYCFGNLSA